MAVYNGEPYLSEAVESILNQTLADFEFIIIDDGSTDNTWKILTGYAARDERIVLHRNAENLGLIRSLNTGLGISRGRYIARQDADDISHPERLERQVTFFENHKQVGLLGTAYYRLYANGKKTLHRPPQTHTEIRWRLLFQNIWPHDSVMFRKSLFEKAERYYGGYLHAEDYELWTRLLTRTRAAALPVPLLIVRTHEKIGVSVTYSAEQCHVARILSAQQIAALLPERKLGQHEFNALQRLYRPGELDEHDMSSAELMFQLFSAFSELQGIDPAIVSGIRRRWVYSALAAILPGRFKALWSSGLLNSILRHDPRSLLLAGLIHLPKTILSKTAQRAYQLLIAASENKI